ncbi:MAG: nuclear transport factor 2 family protein [Gammaproteobacteria bacterium]|nr:nuclear transport factor 2 family protein [Gammaproteobacteria bacterium]
MGAFYYEGNAVEFQSTDEVEAAFYRAFMQGDIEALMEVWWMDDGIECIHPFGPRLTGYKEVYGSWQEVMQQSQGMMVQPQNVHRQQDGSLATHSLVEKVSWMAEDGQHSTEINATHVYRFTDSGWKMVLRHASPSPSQDLQDVLPEVELH